MWGLSQHPGRGPAADLTELASNGGYMSISWKTGIEEALAVAETSKRPLLLDFTAAPA